MASASDGAVDTIFRCESTFSEDDEESNEFDFGLWFHPRKRNRNKKPQAEWNSVVRLSSDNSEELSAHFIQFHTSSVGRSANPQTTFWFHFIDADWLLFSLAEHKDRDNDNDNDDVVAIQNYWNDFINMYFSWRLLLLRFHASARFLTQK